MRGVEGDKRSWFRSPPLGLQPLVIVLANLVPVFGVFFFDWEVFTILFLFWLENVIVGVFNVLKMRRMPAEVKFGANAPRAEIPFFILHYGFFMLGHGIFVFAMFLKPDSPGDFFAAMAGRWLTLLVAFVSLIVEHGYAYYYDFLRSGEYKKPSKFPQFMKPYGRLVVLHVTIIFGGIGVQELGSPRPALLILIALKTLFDIGAWVVRLPGEGALGRIKGACFRSAIAAVVGVWCCVMCFGLPITFIGKATATVSRWIGGEQVGGDHWSQYGFKTGAVFAVLLPAAVWWHHILGGSSRYAEATKLTKTLCVILILALLGGLLVWPALTSYRFVRAEYDAARATKAKSVSHRATNPAAQPQPQPIKPPSQSPAQTPLDPRPVLDPRTGRVAGAIEGETMKILAVTAGDARSQKMHQFAKGKWSGSDQLWWTAARPGDRLTLELPVTTEGRFELFAVMTKARDYGIVQISLGTQKLGEPIDLYNFPDVITTEIVSLGTHELTSGTHALTIEIVGKNPEAIEQYMFGLDYFFLGSVD